jgi:hypothetical protein
MATSSITGKLYRSTLELMIIEVGSSLNLTELPFQEIKGMLTDTQIKSSWDFLSINDLYIAHDIEWIPPWEADTKVMTTFF